MKKRIITVAAFSLLVMSTISCSCTKKNKNQMPSKPTEGQQWRDNNGNNWVWNAVMMRWAMGGIGGGGNNYYYYPGSGEYRNNSGAVVTPPASVSSGIKAGTSSSVSKSTNTSSSKSTSSRSSFGSSGKSSSAS